MQTTSSVVHPVNDSPFVPRIRCDAGSLGGSCYPRTVLEFAMARTARFQDFEGDGPEEP